MDEIVVKVEGSGEETPPAPEPVVVVADAAPAGTDVAVILTLEMLRDQIAELTSAQTGHASTVTYLQGEIDSLRTRVGNLEIEEVETEPEPEVDNTVVVVESIPPADEATEETAPRARKRGFI